jgi:hypothetical protein|tara:strand:- start:2124 stop:2465 length:342 start_codon:yes stop_codon:yes gene_type:complete
MDKKNDMTWVANYYFRAKALATKKLKELNTMGIQPNHKDRKVDDYTLPGYIAFLGHKKAAEDFKCSEASCKSWRYGYRQPSIAQAKQIIQATEGRLDFESIYGSISEILKDQS